MSPKRKLWLSVASLCLVVILGVTSIAVVLASLSANVNNNFSITYTPHNVKATLAGSYNLDNVVTNMSSSGVPGAINFDGSETGSKNFDSIGNIELKKGQILELNYTVINYDNEKTLPVSAELLNAPENLKVTYSASLFNGTNTTTNSQTMTANSPTPTIEVPYSTYSTFDELSTYTTDLDEENCVLAGDLINQLYNFSDDGIGWEETITLPSPRTILAAKWITLFIFLTNIDESSIVLNANGEILLKFQIADKQFSLETLNGVLSHNSISDELIGTMFSDVNLQTEVIKFMFTDEFGSLFPPFTLTTGQDAYSKYIRNLKNIVKAAIDQGLIDILEGQGYEDNYDYYYRQFIDEVTSCISHYFPNYDFNNFNLDLSFQYLRIDSDKKANLMFETCKLLNIPCLYITIKFEIADTTLPASFNGGVNINLG